MKKVHKENQWVLTNYHIRGVHKIYVALEDDEVHGQKLILIWRTFRRK